MADVANDRPVIPIQIPDYHPNPILLFGLVFPLFAHPLALGPPLAYPHDSYRPWIRIGETHRRHIPNLYLASVSFHDLSWLLVLRQRQRLLVSFITLLLEHRDHRPTQLLHHDFEKRSIGIPGIHHDYIKESWPVLLAHPAQQAQGRGTFFLALAHGLKIQNHAQLRPTQLRIHLLVIILPLLKLLALGIFAGHFP